MNKRERRAVEIAIETAYAHGILDGRANTEIFKKEELEKFVQDNMKLLKAGDLL